MRKITVAVLLLAVIFCGCGKKAPELGPRDILDNDTGKILSLHDSRDAIEKVLGPGEYDDFTSSYSYLDGGVVIRYNVADQAVELQVMSSTSSRFSFYGFSFVKKPSFDGNCIKAESGGFDICVTHYDEAGNTMPKPEGDAKSYAVHSLWTAQDGSTAWYTIQTFNRE